MNTVPKPNTHKRWGSTLCFKPPSALGVQNESLPHEEAHIQNNPSHLPALADG